MKKRFGYLFIIFAFFGCAILISSCSDMEKDFEPELVKYKEIAVSDFSPKEGKAGQEITITGQDFGEYANAATVFFNGVPADTILSIENTKIVARAPNEGTTGIITVKVWTYTDSTDAAFVFLPSGKITGIAPAEGIPGDQITISGENFGTDADEVSVLFREGVEAEIVSVEETKIVAIVPEGGITGPVTLQLGPQTLEGPVFSYPIIGLNYSFDTEGEPEGWQSTHNSTYEASAGHLNVLFDPAQFAAGSKRRADLQLPAGSKIHVGKFPIVAIKFDKPEVGNFTFDTNFGAFGGGSNKWTGILIGDVYYFDLSATPFIKDGVESQLSTVEETTFTGFQFKIADITSEEAGYSVDWVRSFESVEALKEAIALPAGKMIYEFDNAGDNDGWTPRQDGTWVVENSALKVTFSQTSGNKRADLALAITSQGIGAPVTMQTANYPIVAMKFTKPAGARVTFDTNMGAVGNGFNKYLTDFEGQQVYYWDLSTQAIGSSGTHPNEELTFEVFQFKIADIPETDPATGYEVDWIRTFESVEELSNFINK